MIRVIEINDPAELAGYRLLWNSLLTKTRGATFFQTLDWLETYWRHFGAEQRLRALVVRTSDEVLGIVPLVVRTETSRLGSLRVLTYPLHDWGMFYGPIGPQPTATLTAALRYLKSRPRDWDLFDLRWVDRDGVDHGRTVNSLRTTGWQAREQVGAEGAVVDLSGGWQAYWSARGHHWRNNVGRCEKKLAAEGEVRFVRYRPQGAAYGDTDPRWDLYEACEAIAATSWQGSSKNGTTLSHESVQDYLRDAHEQAVRAGGVDLNLLFLAGRPAAFIYNYHYQGHLYGLRMGFDASVTKAGSGTALMRRVIEDSFARGDHAFDLGPGSLKCKQPWQTSSARNYRYTHFAVAARPQVLRLKRVMSEWLIDAKAAK
jgi:CelD/BcsL family acetyltransferase involved in cellulose biosynthesis